MKTKYVSATSIKSQMAVTSPQVGTLVQQDTTTDTTVVAVTTMAGEATMAVVTAGEMDGREVARER